MATILTKKSDTSSAVPGSGDLTNSTGGAELAVNTADKRIFTKNSGGTVVELGTNPSSITTGTLSATGNVTLGDASGDSVTINAATVSTPNGLNFDSDTFVIDATNNRVGIGTSSPNTNLEISTGATTNNPSIYLSNSGGYAGKVYAQGDLVLGTGSGATERLRILSANGNVGIGTSSPSRPLHIKAADARIRIEDSDTAGAFSEVYTDNFGSLHLSADVGTASGSSVITLNVDGSERLRIDSSGNVGIGTSSPGGRFHVSNSSNGNTVDIVLSNTYYAASSTDEYVSFQGEFYQNDVSANRAAGYMRFGKSGDFASNANASAYLSFATRNAGTLSEKMRIDSAGNLGLGVTPSAWGGFRAMQIGGTTSLWSTTSGNGASFYTNNGYYNGSNRIYLTNGYATEYIQSSNGSHSWYTAPSGTAGNAISFTQAMTLNASGNLGIGVTSPAQKLHISGYQLFENNNEIRFKDSGGTQRTALTLDSSNNLNIGTSANGALRFINGSTYTERMRIDSSGNVGIGTSSPGVALDVRSSAGATARLSRSGTAGQLVSLVFEDGSGTLGSANTARIGSDSGNLTFNTGGTSGNTGGGSERMRITSGGNVGIGSSTNNGERLRVNASPATNPATSGNMNSGIIFQCGDGSGALNVGQDASNNTYYNAAYANNAGVGLAHRWLTGGTERMRIDSSGNLLVGTTTAIAQLGVVFNGSTQNGCVLRDSNNASSTGYMYFQESTNTLGSITRIGATSAVAYNTTSDYRLKENIAPMVGALAKVAQLKPCTYTWKENGQAGQGFIAHELAEVVPDCVSGEKDAVDEDGNPKYQGVDTSFLVATLTAAIQEQQAIIESLKSRLDAAGL